MRFPYYERLSAVQKRTYRRSDAIETLEVPRSAELAPVVARLERALAAGDRPAVERACGTLARALCARLEVPPVQVRVLAVRPSDPGGELHGLYDPAPDPPRISLWMRTAAKRRVVAFRTFLRTLIHELLHHFDYELFELEETFHTEGFFKRESSVAHQLLGEPETGGAPARARPGSRGRPAPG